jgi:hypothetical protein
MTNHEREARAYHMGRGDFTPERQKDVEVPA